MVRACSPAVAVCLCRLHCGVQALRLELATEVHLLLPRALLPQLERLAFEHALKTMQLWYVHTKLFVILLSQIPPEAAGSFLPYSDRGWHANGDRTQTMALGS